jgi:AraC-like DNA-binding protein
MHSELHYFVLFNKHQQMEPLSYIRNDPYQNHFAIAEKKWVNNYFGKEDVDSKEEAFMKLYIKNMVSIRCIMVVKAELEKLGLRYTTVELGEAIIEGEISHEQRQQLRFGLLKSGLELMDDKKAIVIEKIKNVIVEMVHYSDELPKIKASEYLSAKLNLGYTYLANLFAEVTGTTIEHYIIAHRIEKVKELLVYDELNETEIAYKLRYSSVAHLCNQFKKVTGLTPSYFKSLKQNHRIALENV